MIPLEDDPSVAALLTYHSFDPEGSVFVQADGSLGLAWRLDAIPCDAASESDLGALASRFEALLRLLPERSAAQVLLVSSRDVKERLDAWAGSTTAPGDSILRNFGLSRVRATEEFSLTYQGAPFVAKILERYFTIRLFPLWPMELLRPARFEARLRESYANAKRELLDLGGALENFLLQTGLPFTRLGEDALVERVSRLMSRTAFPPPAAPHRLVRERVVLPPLDFDLATGTLSTEGVHRRVLSAIELPPVTAAGMLTLGNPAFLDLLPESIVAFNIAVPDQEAVRRMLARKKRLAFCQLSTGDVKVDMAAMKEEADRTLAEMFGGARVLSSRLHLVLSDRDPEALEGRARAVTGALGQIGLRMVEEKGLGLSLFLQALPLAYDPANDAILKRGRTMTGMNLAHLLPLYGAFRGTPTPDLLFMNRRGEPVTFSFFDSNVAPHGIVCGVTGSGKSVFANNLIASVLRKGSRVFVLDRGNSYRKLARLLGGDYVEFHPDRPRSINPCGKGGELSRERLIFLRDLVAEMTTRGREDLASKDLSLLEMAIAEAFRAKPGEEILVRDIQRSLEALASRERSAHALALCLSSFVGEGPYGAFFDRPCEVDFDRPFIVFELGETALEKSVVSVVLLAVIQRITDAASSQPGEKYLLIDEAWTLLRSRATARFVENVFRTYRKYRTAAIMLTQQVADFEGPTGEAIRANAPNRIYLKQTPETVLAMEKLLDLSPMEKNLLASLTTVKGRFSEFLVVSPEVKGVARLVQDPLSYWVTTSDPADNAYLDDLTRKHGSVDLALRAAAKDHPNGRLR